MPKLKTKKTLTKRIKVTKNGKIMKKQTRTGHLKSKWSASKKSRKNNMELQLNRGHIKVIKKLLARGGGKVK
ncbi:hypothetical protein A2415_02055 [candidate division WWE3 bacterium RIFOXYC1_FULL_39_7]|uniref:Large ribosomal subunit protein bL35 n=2 Tax=Katanobacteria TaxID=422282 RepID=A0A1F4X8V5_UNCKA|nr:MAG: hypothetical protein A2415_02055 [candidate division WWE3 bacterium RIFOXYC1_FULL_39_7]OGC78114.1 MAG: hypothetical protein A2619_05175 [candidate division WWE3 bacterium RIFOXYD1_FULL_39_9]